MLSLMDCAKHWLFMQYVRTSYFTRASAQQQYSIVLTGVRHAPTAVPNLFNAETAPMTVLSSIREVYGNQRRPLSLSVRDRPPPGKLTDRGAAELSPTHVWVFAFLSESKSELTDHMLPDKLTRGC